MAVNPETNRIESIWEQERTDIDKFLREQQSVLPTVLLRADGSPVPRSWTVFQLGELVDIKGYTFRVAYIGETAVLFEPVKPTDKLEAADEGREADLRSD